MTICFPLNKERKHNFKLDSLLECRRRLEPIITENNNEIIYKELARANALKLTTNNSKSIEPDSTFPIMIQEEIIYQGRINQHHPNDETLSIGNNSLEDEHPFDEYINQELISNHNILKDYEIYKLIEPEAENEKYIATVGTDKEIEKNNKDIEKLLPKELKELKNIFSIPKGLPPSKGIWDFKLNITQHDLNTLPLTKPKNYRKGYINTLFFRIKE